MNESAQSKEPISPEEALEIDSKPNEALSSPGTMTPLNEESDNPSISDKDLAAIITSMNNERRRAEEAYEANVRRPEYDDSLREALEIYNAPATFHPGDLVQWKKYMKAAFFPQIGAPAIVVGPLEPKSSIGKNGNPAVEPKDLILGFLDGDNEFVIGHYVSNRFMLWE